MKYPRITPGATIALDIETHDSNLKTLGPGVRRAKAGLEDSRILGVALADARGHSWWLPYDNHTIEYLKPMFEDPSFEWITANGQYDFDWLQYDLPLPSGRIRDIQTAQALIYEHEPSFSLDALAKKYLNRGKENDQITQWCESRGLKGDPRQHLAQVPTDLVGKYAAADARQTMDIYLRQEPLLTRDELWQVFDLETDLIPVLLTMRKRGVRIDVEQLHKNKAIAGDLEVKAHHELNKVAGFEVNVNSGANLQKVFDKLRIDYPRTAKGAPSFTKEVLDRTDHPVAQLVLRVRQLKKVDSVYLSGWERFLVGEYIHPLLLPVGRDEGGTVSGRFSGQKPNFQQISSRDPEFLALTRGVIIPEPGMKFYSSDYSSVEYRAFAHYAIGPGSAEIVQAYNDDPHLDYHEKTAAIIAGLSLAEFRALDTATRKKRRGQAKTINFGILFGMGQSKLAQSLGLSDIEAKMFLGNYHRRLPFVKTTMDQVSKVFRHRGHIKSLIGRRFHFLDKDYVGVNRLTQSYGADMIKMAMVTAFKEKLFDRAPYVLQVHDELAGSFSDPADLETLKEIMENTIQTKVPTIVEYSTGASWAECK